MKVPLLMGALCGIFYQNSAIAKDQDGIVIFGGGNLGCARNFVGQTKNKELHVRCSIGNTIIVDFNRGTTINCGGYIEGNWITIDGEFVYKNNSINNDNFKCYRTTYKSAFGLERLVRYDISSRTYGRYPSPMLLTYDVLSATAQVCVVPYYDMEMACTQEKTPP
jgi:hypothetical protein